MFQSRSYERRKIVFTETPDMRLSVYTSCVFYCPGAYTNIHGRPLISEVCLCCYVNHRQMHALVLPVYSVAR